MRQDDFQERVRARKELLTAISREYDMTQISHCRYCARVPLNGNMRLTVRAPQNVAAFRNKDMPDYCCNSNTSFCAPNGEEPQAPGVRRRCW
jgi:hypothetical protein